MLNRVTNNKENYDLLAERKLSYTDSTKSSASSMTSSITSQTSETHSPKSASPQIQPPSLSASMSSAASRSSSLTRFTDLTSSHSPIFDNNNSFGILGGGGQTNASDLDEFGLLSPTSDSFDLAGLTSFASPITNESNVAKENFMWNIKQLALMHMQNGSHLSFTAPINTSPVIFNPNNNGSNSFAKRKMSGSNGMPNMKPMGFNNNNSKPSPPVSQILPQPMPSQMMMMMNKYPNSSNKPAFYNPNSNNLSQSQYKLPSMGLNTGGTEPMRSFGRVITNNHRGFQMQRAY
jgi:hypothetical protein